MNITHFVTIDRGTGPVSLINVERPEGEIMLRITHKAVFQNAVEVSSEATRTQIASARMKATDQVLAPEMQARVSEEVAKWLTKQGIRIRSMRWRDGIVGVVLNTENEEMEYDAEALRLQMLDADPNSVAAAEKPRRRRMMMG